RRRLFRRHSGARRRQHHLLRADDPPPLAARGIAHRRARAGGGLMRLLDHDDADDPILSVVNLIDLFLVVIGILMIVIVTNPLNPFSSQKVTVVENPGEQDMRITIKDGQELTRYESSGKIGEGEGVRAGITYRLNDGRMIYVPEAADATSN